MSDRLGRRLRFRGRIAGVGSRSGTRVVVGHWLESPYGEFGDAMVETAAGHRVLLAPDDRIRDLVSATYRFDEVRVEPFTVAARAERWVVRSDSLELDLRFGGRTPVGRTLRLVPERLAESPTWCTVTDPVARLLLNGVRTRGTAGGGRKEWYGATDAHRVVGLAGAFDGADLGGLAVVDPPCRFGFSSTPRTPTVTTVVTTVETRDI
jgi:hypothetical protein